MSRERKILLILFFLTLQLFITYILSSFLSERITYLEEKIVLTRKLSRSSRDSSSKEKESTEEDRLRAMEAYARLTRNTPLYVFGQELEDKFRYYGLDVLRFQEVRRVDSEELEFHLNGIPRQLLIFLNSLENGVAEISQLVISTRSWPARITLRIAPSRLPEDVCERLPDEITEAEPLKPDISPTARSLSPYQLSRLFPYPPVADPDTQILENVVQEKSESEPNRNALKFVGMVNECGVEKVLYFKNRHSGEIIKISPSGNSGSTGWSLLEKKDNMYVLMKDEMLFEVSL